MSEPPLISQPSKTDAEHLKLLAIFHFVMAGLSLLGMGFLVFQWIFMRAFFIPQIMNNAKGGPPPEFFLVVMKVMLVFMGIFSAIKLVGNVVCGWCILQRRARLLCLIMAGVNCISFPFGTALGVFTFVVLLRKSVTELYAAPQSAISNQLG